VPTDFELLDAWKDGDKNAGNELFARHFDSVCAFFRNKVGDGIDDLIQRTFLACVESRDRFRKEASFRTYLFSVARNELYGHFRRKQRHGSRLDPLETSIEALGPSPTAIVGRRREQKLLLKALRMVPVEHQVALELFYWEDMSGSELARVLEIPEGTIRTRLRRAKQLLEEALQELGEGGEDVATTMAQLEDWVRSIRAQIVRPESED
jgi:RNA polymerase sigma-70 factor (ECF subfamily)